MGLGESMAIGYRSLMYSADLSLKDEEAKLKLEEQATEDPSSDSGDIAKDSEEELV